MGLKQFIWNKEEKKFLGRNAVAWAEISIYYFFYYSCLMAFYSATVCFFYSGISPDQPNLMGEDSFLNNQPGMGYRPKLMFKVNLINIKEKYMSEILKSIADELTFTNDKPLTTPSCHSGNDYGYRTGNPCVLIKLNKIFGFKPKVSKIKPKGLRIAQYNESALETDCSKDSYGEMSGEMTGAGTGGAGTGAAGTGGAGTGGAGTGVASTTAGTAAVTTVATTTVATTTVATTTVATTTVAARKKKRAAMGDGMTDAYSNKIVWLQCKPMRDHDKDKFVKIEYEPMQGFPLTCYPFKAGNGKATPYVFLKLSNLTPHALVEIECRVFADNIPVDKEEYIGYLRFQIINHIA